MKERLDELIKNGDMETVKARMEGYNTELQQFAAMKDAKEFISDAGSTIRGIERSRTMTPEAKRAQIDTLRRQQQETAKKYVVKAKGMAQ